MNRNNYVTLGQAQKIKELGYPQDKTDCVWTSNMHGEEWELQTREKAFLYAFNSARQWYAAPNAQEIELRSLKCYATYPNDGDLVYQINANTDERKTFGKLNYAQARADAWIWERENK